MKDLNVFAGFSGDKSMQIAGSAESWVFTPEKSYSWRTDGMVRQSY